MSRQSPHEKLKPKVFDLLRTGAKPIEVLQRYPQLKKSTVYDWAKEFRITAALIPELPELESENSEAIAVNVEVVSTTPQGNLVGLPTREESDYQLARKTIRNVLKSESTPPHTKVIAVGALTKLIEMRYNLPAHILDETTKSTLDEQRDRIRNLPPDEITRRYREAL